MAALTFYWGELERQVRIEGTVRQTERSQSEDYFRSRPRASRLGAWVSQQSDAVGSREVIEQTLRQLEDRFAGTAEIPAPVRTTRLGFLLVIRGLCCLLQYFVK